MQSNQISSPVNITGALGYTSEIFWHFFGRDRDLKGRLELLQVILTSGKLLVEPPRWEPKLVQISSDSTISMDAETPPEQTPQLYFVEPKMVCLADIPIHCLPIHAQRYQRYAFGFSKEKLTNTYRDRLRTVMLYKTGWTQESFKDLKQGLLRQRPDQEIYEPALDVAKFFKFESGALSDECFENIYLEREWRSLDDVTLKEHLEIILVPREAVPGARHAVNAALGQAGNHISIVAWESLFGEEEQGVSKP